MSVLNTQLNRLKALNPQLYTCLLHPAPEMLHDINVLQGVFLFQGFQSLTYLLYRVDPYFTAQLLEELAPYL